LSNENYLLVSYFVVGILCLGIGVGAYLVLAPSFAQIAGAVAGGVRRNFLKSATGFLMLFAAAVGFLSISYTDGCLNYEQVVRNRDYLVRINQQQVQSTGGWVVAAVFLWCIVVMICLVALRNAESKQNDS
jgi:hypothetical protein